MNGAIEENSVDPKEAAVPAAGDKTAAVPELDLDRLVWDPEYRDAMRAVIKRGR
jgi:hypothetical protein